MAYVLRWHLKGAAILQLGRLAEMMALRENRSTGSASAIRQESSCSQAEPSVSDWGELSSDSESAWMVTRLLVHLIGLAEGLRNPAGPQG